MAWGTQALSVSGLLSLYGGPSMIATYLTRLAVTWTGSLRRPREHVLSEVRLPLHIWPTDLDLYGHVNNGRYLTLMDFGRFEHGLRTGLLGVMWRTRALPLIGSGNVQFLRELKALQRCELTTQLVAWDAKRFLVEHRIERAGQLHARAVMKVVLKRRGKTVPLSDLLAELGVEEGSPVDLAELARDRGL